MVREDEDIVLVFVRVSVISTHLYNINGDVVFGLGLVNRYG